jgi:hypothetical protein
MSHKIQLFITTGVRTPNPEQAIVYGGILIDNFDILWALKEIE